MSFKFKSVSVLYLTTPFGICWWCPICLQRLLKNLTCHSHSFPLNYITNKIFICIDFTLGWKIVYFIFVYCIKLYIQFYLFLGLCFIIIQIVFYLLFNLFVFYFFKHLNSISLKILFILKVIFFPLYTIMTRMCPLCVMISVRCLMCFLSGV